MWMKILITGAAGMLGRTLVHRWNAHEIVGVDREDCDICDVSAVDALVASVRPKAVVHCAAMTAVDDCELQQDLAYAVNAVGSANVAAACATHGARLVAISTDYVFSGDLDRPYHEDDAPGPRSVYGSSKLKGEDAVRERCEDHLIVRTAWLYGQGGPSFVHTMLRLGAETGEPVRVVHDQVGNPTSADALAEALHELLPSELRGTIHLTCEGVASWCDFAREVFGLAKLKRPLEPCRTDEYPLPAPRPANSRLENRVLEANGLPRMPHWRTELKAFLRVNPDG
jgi:dTDP-4-dehydrorhamnose reductase